MSGLEAVPFLGGGKQSVHQVLEIEAAIAWNKTVPRLVDAGQ
jgi:hypothetical protein